MTNASIVAFLHPTGVGFPSVRNRLQRSSASPAARKRNPPLRNGGSVSTVNRMARYVEPQMK